MDEDGYKELRNASGDGDIMEKRKRHGAKAIFQIVVLVIATIAFAYFAHQSAIVDKVEIKISPLMLILKLIGNLIFSEKGLVSAQSSVGTFTCVLTKNNEVCKEYLESNSCAGECTGACIPNPSHQVAECTLGTCYDADEGTCQINSQKAQCEKDGGGWLNDPNGNSMQCRKGCCIIGNNAQFTTERRCTIMNERGGTTGEFKPEVRDELSCIALSQSKEEGACITGTKDFAGKYDCSFIKKEQCLTAKGEFHSGYLCSSTELSTKCEKETTTNCAEGKDEIYWFDSCGNRENIYEGSSVSNKEHSWNGGKILWKNESCSVNSGLSYLANQGTCGNCNYLLSSRCGAETNSEKLIDPVQKVVCRSLSCVDEKGKTRGNGESWCVYQGAIGLDSERAIDTPGSRHFKKLCIDGEIRIETCGDFRQGICVESKIPVEEGKTFSNANCIRNLGDLCVTYNQDADDMKKNCRNNDLCYLKEVNIDKDFKFAMCVPKYAVGHNVGTGEGASACALATVKCTAVKVHKQSGRWEFVSNEDCTEPEFAEKMNDLCMSLGDCGAEVNYMGDLTLNYEVSKSPKLSNSYKNKLEEYSKVIPGRVAEIGNVRKYYGSLGIPTSDLSKAHDPEDITEELKTASMITGMGGALLMMALPAGAGGIGVVVLPSGTAGAIPTGGLMGAAGAAVAGAAIGFALTYYLISATGIGPGLSPGLYYSLLAGGALAGAAIYGGAGVAASLGASASVAAMVPVIGWIVAIIIIIIIVVLALAGVGDTKKIKVKFSCDPWEPPRGGKKCDKCGTDGLPCSEYACSALGQTCLFLNEGTKDEVCADIAPNDITPPTITPWQEKLPQGWSYQTLSGGDFSGVKVASDSADGCIDAYSIVNFGIRMDQYGKCRYSTTPNIPYEEMGPSETEDEPDMGGKLNLAFQKNFTVMMRMPSFEALGYSSYDVNRKLDFNLHVKCENGNGYTADRDYTFNFCLKPGNDSTAPMIERYEPALGYVKNGLDKQNLSIWTNEPSSCRWDAANKDYSMMLNNFTCENDYDDQGPFGWACVSEVPLSQDETSVYVRCEDKPWESDATKRNKNTQSTPITLKKTKPLVIDSAKPDNEVITSGVEPASVPVELRTSGGVDGSANCKYSFDGENYISFRDTLGAVHRQVFESFTAGDKAMMLRCDDIVGNSAWKNITFSVQIDRNEPQVSRIFYDGANLVIKTNEDAKCAMSTSSCDFEFVNGTEMTGSGISHSASVIKGTKYYVKCTDAFNNMKGACDVAVKVVM
jgi:hypothetical protein